MSKIDDIRAWSLYEVSKNFQAILADLEFMTDVEAAEVLSCLTDRLEDRVLAVAAYELNLRAEAAAVRDAAARMTERRKRIERHADRLHKYLQESMQAAGTTLVKCPEFTCQLKRNPARVEVVHEDMIPAEYWSEKTVRAIDKKQIATDLRSDMQVPGAMLVQDIRLEVQPGPNPKGDDDEN